MTAKRQPGGGLSVGYVDFWDALGMLYWVTRFNLLYGDWNMSLLVVKTEMAKRGIHIELCAWTPVELLTGSTKFDSCAMFLVGGTVEPPRLLFGFRFRDKNMYPHDIHDGVDYLLEGDSSLLLEEDNHEDNAGDDEKDEEDDEKDEEEGETDESSSSAAVAVNAEEEQNEQQQGEQKT